MGDTMIFFVTDVHGSDVCFRKFLNAAKVYNADALIMGGDITGKQLITIVEQPDGNYKALIMGAHEDIKKPDLEKTLKMIINSGNYPYVTNPSEMEELSKDRSKVDAVFKKLTLDRIEEWMILANERLKGTKTKLYVTGGNDDALWIEDILKKYESENVLDAEGRVLTVGETHEMISTGYSNITPWHCPRDLPEEELERKIIPFADQVKNLEQAIFNLHCPPYDTNLDYAPALDKDLRIIAGAGGQPKSIPCGSKAVKKILERYQPLLGLHGHIHEGRGYCKIGRTLCINPGSEYGEGVVRGAYIVLADKKVKTQVFTMG